LYIYFSNFIINFSLEPRKRSLREYVSILYTEQKMKILLMAQKFELKTYIPQGYKFLSKNLFKRKTEISLDELRNEFEDS
jgi:hypothetical protein